MAVLTGGKITTTGQTTVDIYHLSNDIDTFQVDYWFPHESYITTINTGSLKTDNFPVTNNTWSLNSPSKINHSYLIDYYYRIHYSEININAGFTLSEQVYNIEIWNSYFVNDTLNSITLNGLTNEDVELALLFSLPHTFKPLENSFFDLKVLSNNTPTIEGGITFNWTSETSGINVTATHVSLWPFAALTDFTETREWLTDIIPSRLGEQSFAHREYPRMTLNYNFLFRTSQEYTTARNIARTKVEQPMAVPLFANVIHLTGISAGSTEVLFNTEYLELEVGDLVVFWESYLSNETLEVLTISFDRIGLKTPLIKSYAKVCLAVVKSGYLVNGINFTEEKGTLKKGTLQIEILNPYTSSSWPNAVTYKSLPVLTARNIVTGGLNLNFNRQQDRVDSSTGIYTVIDDELYNRTTYAVSLAAHTKKERYILRRQLDYIKGKFAKFWVKSCQDDLKAVTTIIAGNNTLKVLTTKGTGNRYTSIYIKGSSEAFFDVTGIADNLDGTESITLSPVPSINITNITSIQLMFKVRSDTDSFSIQHEKGIMSCKFIVKEIP